MANSEDMQVVIMQMAIQAATAAVRVMRKTDQTCGPHTIRNSQEGPHRPRQA